ncbi:hypothetical protein AGR1B_Lc10364 [Agrobacterium fabacearum S56]|nr:hypothetical protein AGR1B_Lc10364 [Agrobacterium fabacearum S56]
MNFAGAHGNLYILQNLDGTERLGQPDSPYKDLIWRFLSKSHVSSPVRGANERSLPLDFT